ncbi:hypothetical protein ACFWJW_27170 [Streptomyces sp. NPDC127097]|uniref:hypothetical protein n=1 Tax=Streptomyces sp. NPDC127097 TaxID=3347136 RepID=UPI003650688A
MRQIASGSISSDRVLDCTRVTAVTLVSALVFGSIGRIGGRWSSLSSRTDRADTVIPRCKQVRSASTVTDLFMG